MKAPYVDQPCSIGKGTRIWHFSHIMKGAVIGQNCSIGQNVVVSSAAVVGNGVKIQNNVSIYDAVTIEDGVFCGPSMVFTNVINPRSEIIRKDEYKADPDPPGRHAGGQFYDRLRTYRGPLCVRGRRRRGRQRHPGLRPGRGRAGPADRLDVSLRRRAARISRRRRDCCGLQSKLSAGKRPSAQLDVPAAPLSVHEGTAVGCYVSQSCYYAITFLPEGVQV